MPPRPHVVGVDLCRGEWLAASITIDRPGKPRFCLGAELSAVIDAFPGALVIGIDIPIGLHPEGPREADAATARFIGRRASSVFRMPPRAVLEADTHALAVQASRALGVAAPSIQAYGLRARIFEAEAVAALDPRVIEVHPEASLRCMAGEPLAQGKKTWNGSMQRRQLLATAGIGIPPDLGLAGRAAIDDVLDACAAAWTAARYSRAEAGCFPDPPQMVDGRRVAIWY